MAEAATRPEFQASETILTLPGRPSALAQTELAARGWTVCETCTAAAER